MQNNPYITIFSPNYNGSKFIRETIESVLNQTYKNFEYIIIDDCSTDNSWDIIQEYANKDKRIKCYRNEKNMHIVATRNRAFQYVSNDSKYFSIIDSDDIFVLEKIEKQIKFLEENHEYGLIGSNMEIIDETSKAIGYRDYPSSNEEIRKVLLRQNPFGQSSLTLRMEAIKSTGMYDSQWRVCSDYDFWLRIGKNWKLANINEYLVKYRLSSTQIKTKELKLTVQNTYKIQENAIKNLSYQDSLYNKIYRLLLKISSLYPKIAYRGYKSMIKKKAT